tara:strand:- start:30 stop:800 length:771 start_codon:yes stop_codon:yes gene_type:complete
MTIYNTEYISDAMSNDDATKPLHHVFLNLKARNSDHTDNNFETNRIGLKCETVGISTGRTIPSVPIPGMGVITGESQTIAMDLGMASKTINLSGIITNQVISKSFDDVDETDSAGNPIDSPTVEMTAYEVAQLLHSFVDSSGFQKHQTLNELIILIPSRVDHKYEYYSDLPEASDPTNLSPIEHLPLIPFTYKTRNQDNKGTIFAVIPDHRNFPKPIQDTEEIIGLRGFIRSFSTTLTAGQPFVQFNLDFEVALVI